MQNRMNTENETFFDQVGNFLEGHLDDSVHDNAGVQYVAGLDPTLTRTATAKCCKWCDQLAGTYDYEKVRNKGNDVWKRHKNCHCIIDYNPGKITNRSKIKIKDQKLGRTPATDGQKNKIVLLSIRKQILTR